MWTAFGIMLGDVMSLAFFNVADTHNIKGLNWRLMLASVSTTPLHNQRGSLTVSFIGWCSRVDYYDPNFLLP